MKAYSLRPMRAKDLRWVLKWRNAESIRSISRQGYIIRLSDHRFWFKHSKSLKFIFQENKIPKGVVLLNETNYWSFYLNPGILHNRGLGRLMLCLFLVYAEEKGIDSIKAIVKNNNKKSIRLHESLGFKRLSGNTFFKSLGGNKCRILHKKSAKSC